MRKWSLPVIICLCGMLLAGCEGTEESASPAAEGTNQEAQASDTAAETEEAEEKQNGGNAAEKPGKEAPQTDEDFSLFNGVANPDNYNDAASDGKDLYYVMKSKIFRLNPEGEDEQVFPTDGPVRSRIDMTGGDGMLFYFADCREMDENGQDPTGIFRYDTASGTETSLYIRVAMHLYYHDGWVYYHDGNEKQLRRCRADGSEDMLLAEGWGEYFSISGKWLYFSDGHGSWKRIHLDSLETEEVKSGENKTWYAYQGELTRVDGCLFNTDGDLLYISTPNGLFSSSSADHPEETLLFEPDHTSEKKEFPAFDSIVISGDYVSFRSGFAGEHHWYVIKKDGTFVKEIPYD